MTTPYCEKHEWPGGMEKPCPDCAELAELMGLLHDANEAAAKAEDERDVLLLQNREMKEALEMCAKILECAHDGSVILGLRSIVKRGLSYTEKQMNDKSADTHECLSFFKVHGVLVCVGCAKPRSLQP